ncbi:TonB-dependent receptor domain-containing protein [Parvularcula maris]|uniref:TonB-dependent receptor n=1 Tax=Parvularcula maris TaxID=2965077 RepID=A0A9X2LB46_9PROT|nr:TonB-dependent receptor [Parvularcula maris]MCQ8186473.1 TonB-dependent receptor [Parvularcula maris]
MKKALFGSTAVITLAAAAYVPAPAYAQEVVITDEIVVTGSRLRQGQEDSVSPLTSLDSEEIADVGAFNIGDLTQTLTINTGAENNPDAFTQAQTTGTENINLRGLGLGATLVLLDGQRQVQTAVANNAGVNFVDTASLVPLIAVERLEILKDGASAIYGSDAVAGVANFITRKNFDGALFSGTYLNHPKDGQYDEYLVQGLFGKTFGGGSVMIAASYLDRSDLTTAERRLSRVEDDTSNVGNPGSFYVPGVVNPATGAPLPVIDPTGCSEVGGIEQVLGPTTPAGTIGLCRFDFGDFYAHVANEERLNIYGRIDAQLSDTIDWTASIGYADNEATRNNSPTYPFLQSLVVPAANPFNIYGTNVGWLGRPSGTGGEPAGNAFTNETLRISSRLTGDAFNNGYWEIGFVRAENDATVTTPDVVTDRFQCSLLGFQEALGDAIFGEGYCDNAAAIAADQGVADQFFNPFATSLLDPAQANSPELFDYLIEDYFQDLSSTLTVIDASVTTNLFELPAGPVAVALGAQYRLEERDARYDEIGTNDGFGFLIGARPYANEQDVYAVFGEASVPLAESLDLSLALRYEDYGDLGNTLDPKVGLLFRPTDRLSMRATYSTSFRTPTVFQRFGLATALNQVFDPNIGGNVFVGVRATGAENLRPEESRAYNFGVTFEPIDNLVLNLDYFDYNFEDVITVQNYQGLVDADPNGEQILRNEAGQITLIFVERFNANSVETSGFDFSAYYTFDTPIGEFNPSFVGTYIDTYDLQDPFLGDVDGAGNRNFRNFGSPTPQLRFNLGLEWNTGLHSANVFYRYIDGYDDDQNPGRTVDSDGRVDLRYAFNLGEALQRDELVQLYAGVRNLTHEEPPQVFTNAGYDSKVHDPRGRLFYFGLDVGF